MNFRLLCRVATLFVLVLALATMVSPAASADNPDYDLVGGGHFYKQANSQGGAGETGFAITDAGGIPFWTEYRRLRGPDVLGYPVSRRFVWDGFTVQAMQKAVFQWRPDTGSVAFVNVMDRMHDLGKDGWLVTYRQTPPPFDTSPDTGLSWSAVVARHLALLDTNQPIKSRFFADASWMDNFGLPVSYADEGNSFVIRTQRAVFQYWKEDVPWAKKGEVTIANAGDLAKEAGLFPTIAVTPEASPNAISAADTESHDWRTPGFVAAVGGRLYDPSCVPLNSAGTNVPNLPFRDGLEANLEWMRQHHLRWMRVFATGHALGSDLAPRDARSAIAALRSVLAQVDAFNAAHKPSESIYVLVSLTDYYPPGVPGDRYAYDHPTFTLSPVLPAPWFRAGVRQFDFDQEHNFGRLTGMPNYEVNYKPWVLRIVSSLSNSPSLMGWQLGNELKARSSHRNGITVPQAYGWYLDFTRDMVDTIRSVDRNHVIVTGTQYMAELVDWEYRPKNQLRPDLVPQYQQFVQQMLNTHGTYDWNVFGMTYYDFNPYGLDDMASFKQAGVAVLATEYGFTRGTPTEMQTRFGGDEPSAVQNGLNRSWQDLEGQLQPREWSASELVARGMLAGVASWGSPAPGTDAQLDQDTQRGITGAPDEAALWTAWGNVGATLEAANQAAGPSQQCLALDSAP